MLKVLIVEDDLMIADSAEDIIVESGYEVCGIARTVSEGVALARLHKPDLALVDLRLGGDELGTEVAAQLAPGAEVPGPAPSSGPAAGPFSSMAASRVRMRAEVATAPR
jgi:DNA-binding NarL/FixJ family response regulator